MPPKKPSGARPAPRRLFSFDALKKTGTADVHAGVAGTTRSRTMFSEGSTSESAEEPFADTKVWTEKPLVCSPVLEHSLPSIETPPPLDLSRPNATSITSDPCVAPPLSPSKRRWDTIRHHVLPSISSSVDSMPIPSPPSDVSSFPTRPSTPKLPRFGYRKAFRQVVENVQTQQASEHKRFAEAIYMACWSARFGDVVHHPKPEREGTLGTVGSSLHLPFMASTTSLQMASSSSGSTIQATNKSGGLRRPQSTQSLAQSVRSVPTVTHITRVLSSFSTSLSKPHYLPHENLVLSTLLLPFLDPVEDTQVDMEQVNALETFEYAVRTWKASSNEAELERCLWCCRAASVPSRSRIRLLGTLSSILFSRDRTFSAHSPIILQTLLQWLFSLKYRLSLSAESASEAESLSGYISAVRSGSCGDLLPTAIEAEFGVPFSRSDNEAVIRDVLVTESVIRCLEVGDDRCRRWMLRNTLEEHWPVPEAGLEFTRLLACAHWRKLQAFMSSVLILFSQPSHDVYRDAEVVVSLFRTRIIPEIRAMPKEDAAEIRRRVVRLVLELMCMQDCTVREYTVTQFYEWYQQHEDWRGSIEEALRDLVAHEHWDTILRLIPSVISESQGNMQASLVSCILPWMNNRLVVDPPELPCLHLRRFLEDMAQLYPKIFFKPLFTCAAANKDINVVNQLCILNALVGFVPDLWLRDAEMMSVALMSDAIGSKAAAISEDGQLPVGKARLGQCILMVELLEQLRTIMEMKDLAMMSVATRFAVALEARLGLIIEAKEKSILLSGSQRLLFCALFRELRLITRSLKPASWLESAVSWVLRWPEFHSDDDSLSRGVDEVTATFHKLQALYMQAQEGTTGGGKRRNTAMSILSIEKKVSERSDTSEIPDGAFVLRSKRIQTMLQTRKASLLNLLVLLSGLLTPEHYVRLGSMLWNDLLDPRASTVLPTCFLVMQFAEKRPEQFTSLVESDLANSDPLVRHQALQKIGILSTWRFQILAQDVILDRAHRRPFKLQRPPVLFVATDIGSSVFIYEDDSEEHKDINGHVIPLELRRRLSEIGWAEDRVVDRRLQRVKTPMTLLPNPQLERVDFDYEESSAILETQSPTQSPSPSPGPSPTKTNAGETSLVRRDSVLSVRSQGVKRRPVFVTALVELFPKVAALVTDRDLFVASAAQDVILDFMRDDPSLLSRTVFHLITGDRQEIMTAFTTLRAFLHVHHSLPPAMTHHVLNHLTGFLKTAMRNEDSPEGLRSYGYAVPLIAKLAPQVSKMSMREIRRAKVDVFLIPSGSLWFPPNAPSGPLFPRHLEGPVNPFEDIPSSLVWITLVRTSQNMLFLRMLRRNPQDVKVIRKTMTRLVLPSLSRSGDDAVLTLVDLVPSRRETGSDAGSTANETLRALSLMLARSYLLLIEQVFQCMSRHLNDREELASLMDGINRTLMTHGDDIGIIAHAMLALMAASTRFKRLFLSGGYTLFMPAVIKVYVEAEHHSNIRHAVEYTVSRFYALHQESFIFQTFDVMAQILAFPHADGPWIATGIFNLFSTLQYTTSTLVTDAAGIHDLNKAQEQEALMVTMAEEVPQTFIAALRRNSSSQEKNSINVPIPEQYEGKRLRLDDLVRLFLTVIAHDPGIQRAEQFLKFLRLLTPHLHESSRSAQNVLRGGVDALGSIFLAKSTTKSKSSEGSQMKPTEELKYQEFAEDKSSSGQRSAPSSLLVMRLEYLSLVLAFTGAGGQIGHTTTARIIEMVKALMKDASLATAERVSGFLAEYFKTVLVREERSPPVKEVITLLESFAPVASAYATKPGFELSGVFDVLVQLAANTMYTSEPSFTRLMVGQYCRIGLDACELVASEELLFSFPLRTTLTRLLNCLVPTAGSEVMEQIEGRSATHDFLAGVILPIVLTLKTPTEIMADSQGTDGWRRETYSRVWLRLLAYILSACERGFTSPDHRRSLSMTNNERHKSQGSQPAARTTAPLMEMGMALQVLKIIIVRAEEDISTAAPGLWFHISTLLKVMLADGDATFAFRTKDYSEPPSPAVSPRVSSFQERQQPPPQTFPSVLSIHSRQTFSPPRMIDYLTWSTIQWLWLRRTPLMIPMRIFVQERIARLATELNLQGAIPMFGSSTSSRPVSTVFSKPRRSMLNHSPASSIPSTPRDSTHITASASASLPTMIDFAQSGGLSPSQGRLAGYTRMPSPISPSGRTSRDFNGQKIIHLGPVPQPPTNLPRPVSVSSDPGFTATNAKVLARETMVRSPELIRMTYRRIRLVQHLMGYTTLLPLGGSEYSSQDGFDVEMRVWTTTAAIEAIVDETKELMAEFKGIEADLGDESLVYIDSREFLLPSGSQES